MAPFLLTHSYGQFGPHDRRRHGKTVQCRSNCPQLFAQELAREFARAAPSPVYAPAMTQMPANWYPDPSGTGGLRYWDGHAWTEHPVPLPGMAAKKPSKVVNRRNGWGLLATGVALLLAATFLAVFWAGPVVKAAFFADPCRTPCAIDLELEPGSYLVFEEVGSTHSYGPFSETETGPPRVSPTDVTVTSANGARTAVNSPGADETITRDDTIYRGVASFRVGEAGRYRIAVAGEPGAHVFVAPGLGRLFLRAAPVVLLALLGLASGITGLVFLLTSRKRQSSGS